ncbi:MAG: O-antigen ligase family protein [Actinomycetes bacterium]
MTSTTVALPSPAPMARAAARADSRITVQLRELTYVLIWIFIFSVPWQGVLSVPGLGTIARGTGALAAVVAAAALYLGGRRHPIGDAVKLTAAFAFWVLLSIFWDYDPTFGMQRIVTMVQLALMVYLLWEFGQGERRFRGVLAAWVAGSFVVGSAAALKAATGLHAVRYSASGTNPNELAYLVCLAVPIAWYLGLREQRPLLRLAYKIFPFFAIVTTLLTASRSALILLVLALAIIPVTIRWSPAATRITAWLAVVAAAAIGTSFLPSTPLQRLSTFSSGVSSGANGRFQLWHIGLQMVQDHPIIGVGTGASRTIVAQSYPHSAGLSNTFLSIFAELGVIGIALFLLLLLVVVRGAVRRPGLEGRLAAVLSVTMIAGLVPLHLDYVKSTWVMIGFLALMAARHPGWGQDSTAPIR